MRFQRIKDLREDHKYTLKDFSKILGLNYRTYAYYESGERLMPHEVLIQIADFFNCSTDYLYGRTDDLKPFKED